MTTQYRGYAMLAGVSIENFMSFKGVLITDRLNSYFCGQGIFDAPIDIHLYTSEGKYHTELMKQITEYAPESVIVMSGIWDLGKQTENILSAYAELWKRGADVRFLDHPFLDTNLYKKNGANLDMALEQVRLFADAAENTKLSKAAARAFANSRRLAAGEVLYEHNKGHRVASKMRDEAKPKIIKLSRKFGGTMNDKDLIKKLDIGKTSFYKYVREIQDDMERETSGKKSK